MPRYLGQHFLQNEAIIKKIVAAIEPRSGETILEVGPGHGELTIPLAKACEKVGAKIFAIEKDKRLADSLALALQKAAAKNVEVLHKDILEFLTGESGGLREAFPRGDFKVVGNIPYYLTGHLLRIIGELVPSSERKLSNAVFLIQKEVAERICAAPPRMNRLAASVQFWAEPKMIARVPRGDFSPPPEVDSAVIALEARPSAVAPSAVKPPAPVSAEQYYATVRALFAQPRKTIVNNLVGANIDRDFALKVLREANIDEKSRPQNLTLENIMYIAAQTKLVHK